jgi:hypothetical protein
MALEKAWSESYFPFSDQQMQGEDHSYINLISANWNRVSCILCAVDRSPPTELVILTANNPQSHLPGTRLAKKHPKNVAMSISSLLGATIA